MVFPEPGRYTWEIIYDGTELLGTADVEAVLITEDFLSDENEELREDNNGDIGDQNY